MHIYVSLGLDSLVGKNNTLLITCEYLTAGRIGCTDPSQIKSDLFFTRGPFWPLGIVIASVCRPQAYTLTTCSCLNHQIGTKVKYLF